MDKKTYLDQIVELPAKITKAIGTNSKIVQLLTNNPGIDMDSDEADDVFDKYIFDYNYVDDTVEETCAFICVDVEIVKGYTAQIQPFKIYINIYCHKNFMKLDPSKFKGYLGTRRENLVRFIDKAVCSLDDFGLGNLELQDVRTITCPPGFTAREMTYWIPDFKGSIFDA